ncbi:MAG: adenylate/guanylate cyclase domain-containing protein, partial [Alphaproteobacteria bacterium]
MSEPRVQRRLAAILIADVVGYSRLMAADESGTLARLIALRAKAVDPLVAEYDGRIVKEMGDGLLIEFASVVDAAQCAIAIQMAVADAETPEPEESRIVFRIGINLGDVISKGEDIFGDGVNIAARLEAMAEPGGICLSGAAEQQIRGKVPIEVDDLGLKTLKNISEPVQVFQVMTGTGTITPHS